MWLLYSSLLLVGPAWGGVMKYDQWDNTEVLDKKGNVVLSWNVRGKTIDFKVEVANRGWVGFGLSPDGTLEDSDVVIGWVDGKENNLTDYHGDKKGVLTLDKQQDWKLRSASQNKTHTVLQLSRSLDTCDEDDLPITGGSQRIVYAYSEKDMAYGGFPYDMKMWQSASINLLQPPISVEPMRKDVSYMDLLIGNVSLPGNLDTFRGCRSFQVPYSKETAHIIKISQLISKGSDQYVKQFSLRKCAISKKMEQEARAAFADGNCPPREGEFRRCYAYTIYAWALTEESVIFPQDLGLPLGGNQLEYFILQISYNNPKYKNDIIDNSGLRLYYEKNRRKHDAGALLFGSVSEDAVVIPPRQKEFIVSAHLSTELLRRGLPKEGINVAFALISTSVLVKRVEIRHFRGNKELEPLASHISHDYRGQPIEYLEKDVKVLRGDQLTLECTYDTSKITTTTFGGPRQNDAMCFALLYYHDPIILAFAYSYPSLEIIAGLTGMNLSSGMYDVERVPLRSDVNANAQNYLLHYDWSESNMCTIQNALRFSPQRTTGVDINGRELKVPNASYPDNLKLYTPHDTCKSKYPRRRSRCSEM